LLAGLFWGAPLIAREVEHGTHRLVWTQGVSRLRWALVKFGLVGAGVVVAAACYALLVTWWRAPLDQAAGGTATGTGSASGCSTWRAWCRSATRCSPSRWGCSPVP
jgi:hypothetical protein